VEVVANVIRKFLGPAKIAEEFHKLAIATDPEIKAMTKRTQVKEVLSELKENLTAEE